MLSGARRSLEPFRRRRRVYRSSWARG